MSTHLRQVLQATDHLTDDQFDTVVREVVSVRRERNAAVAYERAMHTATGGISTRWAEKNTPQGVERQLIASYTAAGLSVQEIERKFRGMSGHW